MQHANAIERIATTAVSVRGQTIIPKPLRDAYHIHEGDLLSWRPLKGGILVQRIVLQPAEESDALTVREWKMLDRLVAHQRRQQTLTRYASPEEAKAHSRKLLRHAR
jgi:bifunctional DNA-binding transcriptional regulator/antitoxin component of YhaV-PrlF toxin-antitoxin module